MSVSVVNGFLCYSSCDEAKARAGKDPHPRPQAASEDQATDQATGLNAQPAVTFGGSLATTRDGVAPADAGQPSAAAGLPAAGQATSIDILA